MIVTKRHSLRLVAVGAISAASVALAGTAMAAAPAAQTVSTTQKAAASKAAITAKPSVTSVRAWQMFRVNGRTTGLKAGSEVTLQQMQHGKWVSLPATTPVTSKGSYSLRVELGIKGKNNLRMVSGRTTSAVFNVTVR